MQADAIRNQFDPCEDGYLYLHRKRLVLFTTQERDAYLVAYDKAGLPLAVILVLVAAVCAFIVADLFLGLALPRGTIPILIAGAGFIAGAPRRKVMARLIQDAASRPTSRKLGQAELEARALRIMPWSTILPIVAICGWTLANAFLHQTYGLTWWISVCLAGFFGLGFLGLAGRKAFGKPPTAPAAPLNL